MGIWEREELSDRGQAWPWGAVFCSDGGGGGKMLIHSPFLFVQTVL